MTLRGYSTVLEEADGARPTLGERERPAAPSSNRAADVKPSPPRQEKPTKPYSQIGDRRGLQPSSPAARQALGGVTKAISNIDQQVALIEMLIAVGPDVREKGTLDESLRALHGLEDELRRSVEGLVSACGDARPDGAND